MFINLIRKITNKEQRRSWENRRNIAIVFILFFVFIYFPFYTNTSNQSILKFYDNVYKVIDPFLVASLIIGLMSLYINGKYDSKVLKLLFTIFFAVSLVFASFFTFGLSSKWELLVYLGHALIIILHLGVWFHKEK